MTVIPHWLEKRAMLSPNDIAVQFINGEKVTFQALRNDAIHFAKQLHALGVQPKSRISLLSNNSYNMVVAIHALSYLEVTVVLLNTKLAQGELLFQFNDSDSTICIYADELKGKIITGIYVNKPRKEYVESIEQVIKEHSDIDPDENINKAYMGD